MTIALLHAAATCPWTLAETLAVVRERRLALVESSRGLRVRHRHAHDLPGLDEALDAYAPALRVWLRLGGADARVPAPWRAEGWGEATRLFAAWFGLLFEPPAAPVALREGEAITDWRRYRASVAARLALGPADPAAARVAEDLTRLFVRFGLGTAATPARRLPMAA
ncbi:MAG TPA: hypothetical protein VK002_08755 [Rubricoccaceae bacterium]|nr:hypothetical protein [Rubricoccaceae bacterium]